MPEPDTAEPDIKYIQGLLNQLNDENMSELINSMEPPDFP